MRPTEILFVEDSDDDAELTLRILKKSKLSSTISRVRDGVEALEFVFREGIYRNRESGPPDLILLDLHMPRVGGIEMLQTLRSDESTQLIPVVILTASSDDRTLIESYKMGALSYLLKPINLAAFTEVLEHIGLRSRVMPS